MERDKRLKGFRAACAEMNRTGYPGVEEPAREGMGTPNFYAEKLMNLLVENSHTMRLSRSLMEILSPLKGDYVYIGCCIDLNAHELTQMLDSDEWDGLVSEQNVEELRNVCAGFTLWEKELGYGSSYRLEDSYGVSVGKGEYAGLPCYWVSHSRIEYVWTMDSMEHGYRYGACLSCLTPKPIENAPDLCSNCANKEESHSGAISGAVSQRIATAVSNVNNPENCVAIGHLAAHPHLCPTSISTMLMAALFFLLNLFRRPT